MGRAKRKNKNLIETKHKYNTSIRIDLVEGEFGVKFDLIDKYEFLRHK